MNTKLAKQDFTVFWSDGRERSHEYTDLAYVVLDETGALIVRVKDDKGDRPDRIYASGTWSMVVFDDIEEDDSAALGLADGPRQAEAKEPQP